MPARRLDVATLRPPDAILTVDGAEYRIRGDLPVETMIELLNAENLIRESGKGQDLLNAVADANELIKKLIGEFNEEIPDHKFGLQEVVGIVSFLASGSFETTAEDEVRDALLDGKPDDDGGPVDETATDSTAGAGGDDGGPLASVKPSRKRSSRSGKSTAGRRNGGSASRGAHSGSTHSNSTVA